VINVGWKTRNNQNSAELAESLWEFAFDVHNVALRIQQILSFALYAGQGFWRLKNQ
jgi:hypothetical protein